MIDNGELSPWQVTNRLLVIGFDQDPAEYVSPDVDAWRSLSKKERQRLMTERDAHYFARTQTSRAVIENRA